MVDCFKFFSLTQRNFKMNIFVKIKNWFSNIKRRRELKKRIEELRKRDPFIY